MYMYICIYVDLSRYGNSNELFMKNYLKEGHYSQIYKLNRQQYIFYKCFEIN